MQIVFRPLINVEATIEKIDDTLDGTVQLDMTVKGRPAVITMTMQEALRLYREFKRMDVEGLAKLHA
jgi:hypothetical protein